MYHHVPITKPIGLFMDNAGGHGRDDIKKEYVRILFEDCNIIVIWQIVNSPEANMLNLGIWRACNPLLKKHIN